MPTVRRRSIVYLPFVALLPLFAVLMVSCSYQGEQAAGKSAELTLTPVYKSRAVTVDQQAPELSVATNSDGTAILWAGVSILRPGAVGIAGVDGDGILSYRRVLAPQNKSQQATETSAQDEGEPVRPVAVNVIDSRTAVMAVSQTVVVSGVKERLELSLHALKDGLFIEKPFVIDDAGTFEVGHVYFINEDEGRFSLFWESSKRVKRQSFKIAALKSGVRVIKKLSAVATVAKREHLAAVDVDGSLYFLTLKNSGVGTSSISVTKTDKEGEVIFENILVAKRAQLGDDNIKWPRLVAGASSFAVTWGGTNLQQVSASGELMGEAVKLKKAGPGGIRIMKTHGEAIIDDMYISTRRQFKPMIGSRELGNSELKKLSKGDEPLFTEIGEEQNLDVLQAAIDFMEPSAETSHGTDFSQDIEDARGNRIDVHMSRASTSSVMIKLTDPKPMIMVDVYRAGRLIKTINLGRGEDVALSGYERDLIAAWTGGDGLVDLQIARWRLKARGN